MTGQVRGMASVDVFATIGSPEPCLVPVAWSTSLAVGAGDVVHDATPANERLSRRIPLRILLFTVPSGSPRCSATSTYVM